MTGTAGDLSRRVLVSLLAVVFADAHAGGVPTPGAVQETVKPTPEAPEKKAVPEVEAAKPAAPGVPAGGPAILVNRFEVSGNSIIGTDELREEIAGFEGRKLTLAEIYGVADKLTDYYRRQGYSLATVSVPAQKVSTGIVRLEVIEGRLGKIAITGNQRYTTAFLTRQMDRLTPGSALTVRDLEEEVQDLNRLPGLTARATVQPGEAYGTSDVVVKARERLFEGSATLDNYGRESLGDWRVSGNGTINNPFGIADRLDLNVLHAEGGLLEYGRFNYDMPLGSLKTHANVYYSHYDYDVDTKELRGLAGLAISGNGDNFGLSFLHPFRRDRIDEIYGGIGIDRTITRQEGVLEQDRDITLMRLTGLYSHEHEDDAISNLSVEFSSNFRHNEDGTENNRQKGKFRLDAVHLRPLRYSWSLLLRGAGVLSFDPLVDTEQFRIGGQGSVRAFAAAEFAGDQGISGTVELRRPLAWIPAVPLQFRAFYDAGIVHRKKPATGQDKTDSLTGLGLGLSTIIDRRYTIDMEVAQPTTAQDALDGRETRFWFALGARF